ncbi:MAG: hypothetical protein QHJ81_12695 [Anaerolineae bacterium]|nr:hypothetical protein [Anaerolineae bacterium]
MRGRLMYSLSLLTTIALLALSVGVASGDGGCTISDWSSWQAYFTPIVPHTAQNPGNPAGRPIPTKSPSHAALMAWVNSMHLLPEPALAAHAEEVARGDDHSTIIGHGPAKGEPASRNAWATGGVLRNDSNPGPFFETFDNFYGETWRMLPHLWGGYAYQGADWVTFDREQVHKDESPYDGSYSMKIAASVPFEAGISREIKVEPGAEVKVRVMYALYDHGGKHAGNVWTYDWAALGVKVDDCDAEWVNGTVHGQWLSLEHTVTAGPEGRIMIFLQVISPLAENVNAYFDNVQVWVNGEPYTG